MRRIFILSGFCCLLTLAVNAAGLRHSEATLQRLFGLLHKAPNDESRILINDSVCLHLSAALQNDSSFYYAFDSLPFLGKVLATDKKLRLYSWNYITDSGDYRFYTFLQFANKKIVKIEQNRPGYLPDEKKTINVKDWYGALYYAAIPLQKGNDTSYYLLGWSRYNNDTNFKVLDILTVNDTVITFGKPVISKNKTTLSRLSLPYSSGHSLSLLYDENRKLFIFNHVESSPDKQENIPDETFSGCRITADGLIYQEDITFEHHDANQPRTKVELNLDSR